MSISQAFWQQYHSVLTDCLRTVVVQFCRSHELIRNTLFGTAVLFDEILMCFHPYEHFLSYLSVSLGSAGEYPCTHRAKEGYEGQRSSHHKENPRSIVHTEVDV